MRASLNSYYYLLTDIKLRNRFKTNDLTTSSILPFWYVLKKSITQSLSEFIQFDTCRGQLVAFPYYKISKSSADHGLRSRYHKVCRLRKSTDEYHVR